MNRRAVVFTAGAAVVIPSVIIGGTTDLPALDENKAVVAEFIQVVWREGRLERLGDYWTSDCINHADQSPGKVGLEALRRYHEAFGASFADFADLDIRLEQQVAEGDRVVTQMTTHGRHKPTGRQVSLATIRIDRLAQGKIAEHWSVADTAGLMQQLA